MTNPIDDQNLTTPPPRTHLGNLSDVLHFTDDDLAANRSGALSPAQRQRLERMWNRSALIGGITVLGIIFGATFLIFIGQRNESSVLTVIGLVLTVVNAGIVGLLAQSRIRLNQDLRLSVSSTQGIIAHTVKVFNRTATYILEVNGERLLVSKPVFFAFEERTAYILYRTAANKTLLSAEKETDRTQTR
ncbi:MAG: hypothetical protein U0670_06505 [Anaerolineae bacterium]